MSDISGDWFHEFIEAEMRNSEHKFKNRVRGKLESLRGASAERRVTHQDRMSRVKTAMAEGWAYPIDGIEDLLIEARSIAVDVRSNINPKRATPAMTKAQLSLFSRGSLVGSEILVLLRTGHDAGAYARWRTLFEVAIISEFLLVNGEEAAVRFVDYYTVEHAKALRQFAGAFPESHHNDPLMLKQLQEQRELLKDEHGIKFVQPYGWAKPWVEGTPNFKAVWDSLNSNTAFAAYKQACQLIHAGPRGILDNVVIKDGSQLLQSNPIAKSPREVGRVSALSLTMLTKHMHQACAGGKYERMLAFLSYAGEVLDRFSTPE